MVGLAAGPLSSLAQEAEGSLAERGSPGPLCPSLSAGQRFPDCRGSSQVSMQAFQVSHRKPPAAGAHRGSPAVPPAPSESLFSLSPANSVNQLPQLSKACRASGQGAALKTAQALLVQECDETGSSLWEKLGPSSRLCPEQTTLRCSLVRVARKDRRCDTARRQADRTAPLKLGAISWRQVSSYPCTVPIFLSMLFL